MVSLYPWGKNDRQRQCGIANLNWCWTSLSIFTIHMVTNRRRQKYLSMQFARPSTNQSNVGKSLKCIDLLF